MKRVLRRTSRIPNLGGRRALVLHKPHANVAALLRQLVAIGLDAQQFWPSLPDEVRDADFLFFDVDMVCNEQFPWQPGEAPMPLVGLSVWKVQDGFDGACRIQRTAT